MKTSKKLSGGAAKVELSTENGGGTITIWMKEKEGDEERAQKLPHIYKVRNGFTLLDEVNFWHEENAKREYRAIKTKRDAINLAFRNM